MGGLNFFCTTVMEPKGDLEMLKLSVEGMNEVCPPDADERRGGAGNIGKMIFSADKELAVVAHVPKSKHSMTKATVWLQYVLKMCKLEDGFVKEGSDDTYAYALIKPKAGFFAIKLKDDTLTQAFGYLRLNKLFPEDDEDEDEMVFGDEDFPE